MFAGELGVRVQNDSFLAVDDYDDGDPFIYTIDCMLHWVPKELLSWDGLLTRGIMLSTTSFVVTDQLTSSKYASQTAIGSSQAISEMVRQPS